MVTPVIVTITSGMIDITLGSEAILLVISILPEGSEAITEGKSLITEGQ